MLKKIGKMIVALLLIIFIILISTVYTFAVSEENQNFVKVSSNSGKPGEEIQLTIDLTKIKYKKFKTELNSNNDIEINKLQNGDTGEDINKDNVEQKNKSLTISNVENLSSLIISYKIPETAQIGSNISINIIITNCEDSDENKENMTENNIIETNQQDKEEKMQTQINISVIDKEENNNLEKEQEQNRNKMKDTSNSIPENLNNQKSYENKKNAEVTTKQKTTLKTSSNKNQQTNTEETYKGSSNNYIESISINNEKIENFNKTNTTYFQTIKADTANIEISTTQTEENETVFIYGNNNLKKGLNKILISVTAQNGSARNYRIYLTLS